jgi:hypothetical protein
MASANRATDSRIAFCGSITPRRGRRAASLTHLIGRRTVNSVGAFAFGQQEIDQ